MGGKAVAMVVAVAEAASLIVSHRLPTLSLPLSLSISLSFAFHLASAALSATIHLRGVATFRGPGR